MLPYFPHVQNSPHTFITPFTVLINKNPINNAMPCRQQNLRRSLIFTPST